MREVMREKGIDTQRIVGLGSGGASAMFGRLNGVGARKAAGFPHLVHMQSVAHRVALVASDACNIRDKSLCFVRLSMQCTNSSSTVQHHTAVCSNCTKL